MLGKVDRSRNARTAGSAISNAPSPSRTLRAGLQRTHPSRATTSGIIRKREAKPTGSSRPSPQNVSAWVRSAVKTARIQAALLSGSPPGRVPGCTPARRSAPAAKATVFPAAICRKPPAADSRPERLRAAVPQIPAERTASRSSAKPIHPDRLCGSWNGSNRSAPARPAIDGSRRSPRSSLCDVMR